MLRRRNIDTRVFTAKIDGCVWSGAIRDNSVILMLSIAVKVAHHIIRKARPISSKPYGPLLMQSMTVDSVSGESGLESHVLVLASY